MSDKTRRQEQEDVLTRDKPEEPKKYKVLLLNDDYTSMEFVVEVLITIFRHSQASATRIMLHIHNNGVGIAGTYTKEVAETRLEQVEEAANAAGYPLMCVMEPE